MVPFTLATVVRFRSVGAISVATPVVGSIWYRFGAITGVVVGGAVLGSNVRVPKVEYKVPSAAKSVLATKLKVPSGLGILGLAVKAGIPVGPIRVAAPVAGFTVYRLVPQSVA